MQQSAYIPLLDRLRLIGYGCIGGLVIGIFLGWVFHGFVGLIVKLAIVFVLLVPLVLAIMFWRRVTSKPSGTSSRDVRDASWIEIDSGRRER
jgi:hypothetical protein